MFAQGSPGVGLDSTVINPRLLLGVETAVIATLLLLLYIYRRQSYILWWMWGWVLLSAGALLSAESLNSTKLDAMVFGLAQFLRLVAGLLFVVATDAYRQPPRLRRLYAVLLLPVAIWFTLAPAALGSSSIFAPGFILVAGTMASAGVAHVLLGRRARLLGATVVGTMLLGFAAINASIAMMNTLPTGRANRDEPSPRSFFIKKLGHRCNDSSSRCSKWMCGGETASFNIEFRPINTS